MLAVFTLNHNDSALALKQAQWIATLGPQKHSALIACNRLAHARGLVDPVAAVLRGVFKETEVFVPYDEDESREADGIPHARAANHLFKRVIQHVVNFKDNAPFLWMETDAIPLKAGWLDKIETEFVRSGRPFMGDLVALPNVRQHMSGIAVYSDMPTNAPEFSSLNRLAFDVALAEHIVPRMHITPLIQHEWRPPSFATIADLDRIRPEAVIYHQCKDLSLTQRLSEVSVNGAGASVPVQAGNKEHSVSPSLTPQRQPVKRGKNRVKKERTPEQIEAAKARMAKVRAARRVA